MTALAWLGVGRIASGSADATIRLWRISEPYKCECCLEGHAGAVRAVALLDAAAGTIVSAGDDCTLRTWVRGTSPATPTHTSTCLSGPRASAVRLGA